MTKSPGPRVYQDTKVEPTHDMAVEAVDMKRLAKDMLIDIERGCG